MNVSEHMPELTMEARVSTIPSEGVLKPFDCLKLAFRRGEALESEMTLLDFTPAHARTIVAALGEAYPGVIAGVAREMNLGPTLEPAFRGGSGFDDPELAEPPCGGDGQCCTAPDRDGCDGQREVATDE